MTESEQALEIAKSATVRLREFCDTVQIFLTIHDAAAGSTRHIAHGDGNWFAREGQVREWALQNEERSRAEAREEEE